ncbi:MAG: hypothetical protein ABSE76_01830 [Minisyncoccia bacterium]|jgi:hypothetical protein
MATITIPKKLAGNDDLVIIPKKELDALIERAGDEVTPEIILGWSHDAKKLHRAGKLPRLA